MSIPVFTTFPTQYCIHENQFRKRISAGFAISAFEGLRASWRVEGCVDREAVIDASLPVIVDAILEGQIYYNKVCADATIGELGWVGVWCAGAIGGSLGDQLWFYAARPDPLARSLPKLAKYRGRSATVHSHEGLMVLSGRFLPGLRTAIPIACAYANVRPLKFSVLSLVSGFAWAGAIMLFVKLGSSTLNAFGLDAWWGPLIPAVLVILFFRWLSRPRRPTEP